jgi:hypothetical protein
MNRKLRWIPLAAILIAVCHGAEIMAYRFACEPFISNPLAQHPLLKQAPTATVFMATGDVLYDLTLAFRDVRLPLENSWVIWNQTQRLLVVHGVMLDQWRIEELTGFRKQTRHAKLTIDWIHSEKPEEFPVQNAAIFTSLGLLGKSGMKSSAPAKMTDASGEWSVSVVAEPTILDRGGIFTRLALDWKGPDGKITQHGNILIAMLIDDAKTMNVASWFVAGHGPAWQIQATADILLSDGSSWREARLRQEGGQISICKAITTSSEWVTIREALPGNNRKLLAKVLPSETIRALAAAPAESDVAVDPFAVQAESLPVPLCNLPDAIVPDHLKDCLTKPLFDLQGLLRDAGVAVEPGDFVAYDPVAERLVVDCESAQIVDLIEVLFTTIRCGSTSATIECAVWLADAAVPESPLVKVSLLTQSGMKTRFELFGEKDQPIVSFCAEPVLGDQVLILDLSYNFRCHLPKPTNFEWHSESALTASDGIPILMDAAKLTDRKTLKQGLRTRVIRDSR